MNSVKKQVRCDFHLAERGWKQNRVTILLDTKNKHQNIKMRFAYMALLFLVLNL